MNKAIEAALKTWYPKNHALHLDPIHPAMGLAGEIGEWINLHKKSEFKSGYKFTRKDELDELGDIWYYLRILAYQFEVESYMTMYKPPELPDTTFAPLAWTTATSAESSGNILEQVLTTQNEVVVRYNITKILEDLDMYVQSELKLSLLKLTALNWEKLKPGSTRGEEWTSSW